MAFNPGLPRKYEDLAMSNYSAFYAVSALSLNDILNDIHTPMNEHAIEHATNGVNAIPPADTYHDDEDDSASNLKKAHL